VNSTRKSFLCPVCGDEVSPNAKACPGCGACDKSGWRLASREEDGLNLPDDDFDYYRFVDEEFGRGAKRTLPQWFWSVVAAVLLLAFAALLFHW
jgi:hypothetical protein